MKTLLPILLVLFGSASLPAQATPLDSSANLSRWTVALNAGIDLMTAHDQPTRTAILGQATVHYRMERWLDLGLHVGYNRFRGAGTYPFAVGEDRLGSADYSAEKRNLLVGAQTRLNVRAGQGDFGVAATLGYVANTFEHKLSGGELKGGVGTVEYERLENLYYQLDLGYHYWLTHRVGITANISYLDMRHAINAGPESTTNGIYTNYTVASSENVPEVFLAELAGGHPIANAKPVGAVFLIVGMVYRM